MQSTWLLKLNFSHKSKSFLEWFMFFILIQPVFKFMHDAFILWLRVLD